MHRQDLEKEFPKGGVHTKEINMLCISAFLAFFIVIAGNAHAACSSCSGEADWSRSADEFIGWDPVGLEPAVFGLVQTAQPAPEMNAALDAAVKPDDGENYSRIIGLLSMNATPAPVLSGGTTRITAVLAINQSERQNQGDMQISAQALIRDSAGSEVDRLILVGSSAEKYFSNWVADVPPGWYRVDLLASSPEETARFKNALQIEVLS